MTSFKKLMSVALVAYGTAVKAGLGLFSSVGAAPALGLAVAPTLISPSLDGGGWGFASFL